MIIPDSNDVTIKVCVNFEDNWNVTYLSAYNWIDFYGWAIAECISIELICQ
jgi:hypothetical protein